MGSIIDIIEINEEDMANPLAPICFCYKKE